MKSEPTSIADFAKVSSNTVPVPTRTLSWYRFFMLFIICKEPGVSCVISRALTPPLTSASAIDNIVIV